MYVTQTKYDVIEHNLYNISLGSSTIFNITKNSCRGGGVTFKSKWWSSLFILFYTFYEIIARPPKLLYLS